MKKKVQCLSCNKIVTVTLTEYGAGLIAVCPKCKKLAYVGVK